MIFLPCVISSKKKQSSFERPMVPEFQDNENGK